MATKITDHVQQAKDRLFFQYKDKDLINGVIEALTQEYQVLENLFYDDLLKMLDIDNATGDMLDRIGTIVNQERLGLDDVDYRVLIRAKIGENTSEGDPETIITVFNIITQTTNNMYIENYPANVQLLTSGTLSATVQAIIYSLMEEVVPGGVSIDSIIYFPPADAFILGSATITTSLGAGLSNVSQVQGGQLAKII